MKEKKMIWSIDFINNWLWNQWIFWIMNSKIRWKSSSLNIRVLFRRIILYNWFKKRLLGLSAYNFYPPVNAKQLRTLPIDNIRSNDIKRQMRKKVYKQLETVFEKKKSSIAIQLFKQQQNDLLYILLKIILM